MKKVYTLGKLAKQFDLPYRGNENHEVWNVGPLKSAKTFELAFYNDYRLKNELANTDAGIVIMPKKAEHICQTNMLFSDNPYLAYAKIAKLFEKTMEPTEPLILKSAVIGKNCKIHPTVIIGEHTVIGDDVTLAAGVIIGHGCVLENGVSLGEDTKLQANVAICEDVSLGNGCLVHSGTVIGCDGFGNARDGEKWVKVPQLGSVRIGHGVEIGANTTIDCGAITDTIIANGVRLDNLIQIAHNVEIGENTAIAAGTGIAGSTKIGRNCMIAGKVGIVGHITIADNVVITGMTMVTKSILEGGIYSSGIPVSSNQEWRKNAVRFKQLDEIARRLKRLETQLLNEKDK